MMKTIKKDYTVPCTIVCKMQMEGVIASSLPLSENNNELFDTSTQHDKGNAPATGGDEYGDGDLEGAKKHNLFYDEE